MRPYRIYNRVRKVGVEWRLFGTTFHNVSVGVLFGVGFAAAMLSALAYVVAGTAFGVVVAVSGLIAFATVIIAVSRMGRMGKLSERLQTTLLLRSIREPVYTNFHTPDTTQDRWTYEWGPERPDDAIFRNY
ncbi:hypothetical protein EEB14_33970 [Rhodococcus sp. WS4]|nr:hypothetical protein EEB14_33970 [Rhodococcus sp. WS4]